MHAMYTKYKTIQSVEFDQRGYQQFLASRQPGSQLNFSKATSLFEQIHILLDDSLQWATCLSADIYILLDNSQLLL